ncbi:MAG: ABC transporter ATP-binding protein [Clostridia bacterium]|nr:ABC transporter ATP-binding protein [Clostridia bacterium]MBQ7930648.1 ABC transporter ATP-binding protein [Clostridia bacterium]
MTVLQIDHLSAGYGKRKVLNDVCLDVCSGEILAVLGENGSGKTTLLRAIQGTLPRYTGTIRVNGIELAGLNTRRRAALVTTMAQDIPAEEGLTGMDRIEMGFYPVKGLFGRLTDAERETIRKMAREFGILSLLERDLAAMSTGERQLISLLRAAVQNTPLLLLDEPSSALDFNRTEQLFSMLRRLAERGKAIVIVLHDPAQALRHADRLLLMTGTDYLSADLRNVDYSCLEQLLRTLYPALRIHRNPLFCYTESKNSNPNQ